MESSNIIDIKGSDIPPIILVLEERKEHRTIFSFYTLALDSVFSDPNSLIHILSIAGSQSSGKSTLSTQPLVSDFPQ